jgi:transposase
MKSFYAPWMGRPTQRVELMAGEREALEGLRKRQGSARNLAFRAGIILGCATGSNDKEVAKQLRTTNWTVGFWRKRFNQGRLEALYDEPRVGAPRSISDQRVEEVITKTLESMAKNATHWSTRGLAQQLGMSQSSISRIWRAFGLQPHRSKSFSLSQDPQLIEKVRDIVGLYMEPPVNAVVLCVEEKGQIQALQRSQPLWPMRPGQVERRTHDYMRHGTTSLFAALEVATGNVLTKCYRRHRSVEFRDFLDQIDAAVPKEREVHIVLDNYATHKTVLVRNWLAKRQRYHLHFTPTHSSWINQVERWFAQLSQKQIKRGNHHSVKQLQEAIETFVKEHNASPKPFRWVKSADQILASITRFARSAVLKEINHSRH